MQLTIIYLFIIIGLKSKPKVAETTENESQYSGHSTSSLRKDQVQYLATILGFQLGSELQMLEA
jgi:hypothetical protein